MTFVAAKFFCFWLLIVNVWTANITIDYKKEDFRTEEEESNDQKGTMTEPFSLNLSDFNLLAVVSPFASSFVDIESCSMLKLQILRAAMQKIFQLSHL